MQRPLLLRLLFVTFAACGFRSQADLPVVHSTGTLRNCQTRIDLRGGDHAVSGIRGEIERYRAAERFSDEWIDVEWVARDRVLHAYVVNKTEATITINAAIVGGENVRAAVAVSPIESGSSQHVPLGPIAAIDEYVEHPRNLSPTGGVLATPVELRLRMAEKECTYQFQLVRGAI